MADTKIVAVVNQKGGVGKTTTTANLAYALSNKGRKVLLLDFDSQASLTKYLNVDPNYDVHEEYISIYEVLQKVLNDRNYMDEEVAEMSWEELLDRAILKPTFKTREVKVIDGVRKGMDVDKEFGFDLLPSSLALSDFDLYLASTNSKKKAFILKALIDKVLTFKQYDYILIDCSPYLGVLTINAIVAATTGVIIPTNLDMMSTWGVSALIEQIVNVQQLVESVSGGKEQHYGVIGIVLNLYRGDRTVDQTIQTDLERFYPFTIFKSTIPESVKAKNAVLEGVIYSQIYKKAEEAYSSLAKEVEKKIAQMQKEGPVIQHMVDKNTLDQKDEEEEF